jgi:hypothetical protein
MYNIHNMSEITTDKMRKWVCSQGLKMEYDDRDTLMQFLVRHLRDTGYIKEGSDGSRVNLDILSDDMIRIIYNFVNDTLIKNP